MFFCVNRREQSNKLRSGAIWSEAENRERGWGETLNIRFFTLDSQALRAGARAGEARVHRARKTLMPHFADFFTDFEEKTRLLCSLDQV